MNRTLIALATCASLCCTPAPKPPEDAGPSVAATPAAPVTTEAVSFGRGFMIDLPTPRDPSPRKNGWSGNAGAATWSVAYFPVPDAQHPVDTAARAETIANENMLSGAKVLSDRTEPLAAGFVMETAPGDGAVDVVSIVPLGEFVLAVRCTASDGAIAPVMRAACRSLRRAEPTAAAP